MQTTTIKSFCNTYVHHDEDNNAIGHTDPNPFSPQEYMHIDMSGNLVGYCKRNFGGGYMHYDADKNYLGRSEKNPFGGYVHYDANGNLAGRSDEDFCGNFVNYDIRIKIFK